MRRILTYPPFNATPTCCYHGESNVWIVVGDDVVVTIDKRRGGDVIRIDGYRHLVAIVRDTGWMWG